MVQLIVGKKGKGKTKQLLDKVNSDVKKANGSIVYLDKNSEHMYVLNSRVRMIDVSEYKIANGDQFIGFIKGITSQDHDIEQMYFDRFLKISHLEGKDITPVINCLCDISKARNIDFILSVSMDEHELPEEVKQYISVSL